MTTTVNIEDVHINIPFDYKVPCGVYVEEKTFKLIVDTRKPAPIIGVMGKTENGITKTIHVLDSIYSLFQNRKFDTNDPCYNFLYWCLISDDQIAKSFSTKIYELSKIEKSIYYGLNHMIYNWADSCNLHNDGDNGKPTIHSTPTYDSNFVLV